MNLTFTGLGSWMSTIRADLYDIKKKWAREQRRHLHPLEDYNEYIRRLDKLENLIYLYVRSEVVEKAKLINDINHYLETEINESLTYFTLRY